MKVPYEVEYTKFEGNGITIGIKMSKRESKWWLEKVFDSPKYAVTETLFPRKKKRGSMRRRRKAARNEAQIIQRNNG